MTAGNERILDEIRKKRRRGRVEVTLPGTAGVGGGIATVVCAIEKLQDRSIDKTPALIRMYSTIAVMILNMAYAARLTPCLPCSFLLGEEEWKLWYCAANKTRKGTKKPYTIKKL
jgi:hypothetical protein